MTITFVNYAVDVSDLITAVTGGLIGALAAGIPAYMIARKQSRELLSRDADARLREEKAQGLTTTVKFMQIVNSLVGLHLHVEACFMSTEEEMEPWQRLIPLVGHSDEVAIRFTDAEISLLARTGEAALMQDLLLLANRHSSSIVSWENYCLRRDAFVERAPRPTHFDGELGSSPVSKQQVLELKVYTIPLNNLAVGLLGHLHEYIEFARSVAERLPAAYDKYFKTKGFTVLRFPSSDDLVARVKAEADRMSTRRAS